jgi:hypothetical protein
MKRSGMTNTLRRLVRRVFPAPGWALLIFGACIIVCLAMKNWLAASWAFTAGAWCQAKYESDQANAAGQTPAARKDG